MTQAIADLEKILFNHDKFYQRYVNVVGCDIDPATYIAVRPPLEKPDAYEPSDYMYLQLIPSVDTAFIEEVLPSIQYLTGEYITVNGVKETALVMVQREVIDHKIVPSSLAITKIKTNDIKVHARNAVCSCDTTSQIVYLDTIKLDTHELHSLDEFYCPKCNSFWREP